MIVIAAKRMKKIWQVNTSQTDDLILFEDDVGSSSISFYNGDKHLPIYDDRKDGFSLSEIGNVLICGDVSKEKICCMQRLF